MSRTESTSRYGRTAVNHAEPPASPAAATNGSRGRQQLEAATALARAAVLARMVPLSVWLWFDTAISFWRAGQPANALPDQINAWRTLGAIPADIGPAAKAYRRGRSSRGLYINSVYTNAWRAKKAGCSCLGMIQHLNMPDFSRDPLLLQRLLYVGDRRQIVRAVVEVENLDDHVLRLVVPAAIRSITGQPRGVAA